jgi:hypothetical protein
MNYLDICKITDIKMKNNFCVGFIDPKNYSLYNETEVMTLFLEGVHQFCVKIIYKYSEFNNSDFKRMVPSQIKNFVFYQVPELKKYYLKATFTEVSQFYIVNVAVFTHENMDAEKLLSQGQIYLAGMDASEIQD